VRDAHTGKQLAVFEGHTNGVLSVTFSPDGTHILSGSRDQTVRVWEARTGKQLSVIKGHTDEVNSVAFSPDSKRIVSGSDDTTVRMWDAYTGKQLSVLEGHTKLVLSVAFSPDGAHIVSGSSDRTFRIWDARTGKQLAVLKGHMDWVRSVTFSPDGAHIVSGSDDRTVWVWDAHTGKQITEFEGHTDCVMSVSFSPDGKHITSKDYYGAELAWNVPSTLHLHEQSLTRAVAHSLPDARESAFDEGTITDLPLTPIGTLAWNEASGWISWQRSQTHLVRLYWLPHERRGTAFACHHMTAVIGGQHGAVTVLDFSEVIAMHHSSNLLALAGI
jgi:WD40 repeat protein